MSSTSDSFDELVANMKMPDVPGSTASIQAISSANEKPGEKPAIPSAAKSSHTILVNPNQRGNPLLKAITSIPYEFNNEIIPDYVVGAHGEFL